MSRSASADVTADRRQGLRSRRSMNASASRSGKVNQQPVATFVCPGHPLLEAVISIVREQHDHLMKQGAVMVDETDLGQDLSAIFLLEHRGASRTVARPVPASHIISEKLQFASIDKTGKATNAGGSPRTLIFAPPRAEEIALVFDKLHEDWLRNDLEKKPPSVSPQSTSRRAMWRSEGKTPA